MFRRKPRSKSSFLFRQSCSRGSDIVKPNNTSLIVNESDTESDELPRELTSILSEEEDGPLRDTVRRSSSLMKSLSQKKQSTPLTQTCTESRILKEKNITGQSLVKVNTKSKSPGVPSSSKITTQSREDKPSYFEEVLRGAGASPLPGSSSYLMREDQAVFAIKVNDKLKEDPKNVQHFLQLLKEKINENDKLQKMLAHTLTADNCELARGPIQDPLIRILLSVECLQADLLELLLEKIADIVLKNETDTDNESIQIVSSILRQMKFLSRAQNCRISTKLFEIIHVSSFNVKREIIFTMPEIISEEEIEGTCTQLIDILKCDTVLTNVIMDALINLPLNKTVQSQVCTKILNRLDKSPVEFLPSLVQFILSKSDPEEFVMVINGLREKLQFAFHHFQMKRAECSGGSEKIEEDSGGLDSYIKLIFENVKFSVMASKQMSDAWIRVISGINSSTEFRSLDLTVLIIFYNCLFGRKNQIFQMIKHKIKSLILTQEHIQTMFKILLVIAVEYFPTILELASALLKCCEQKISSFGGCFYKECFSRVHFHMQQSVVNEILLHVGTGSPGTINTALCTLKDLCENQKKGLAQHATSIMGLLIKVPNLNIMHVRLLMDVLADLVFFKSSCGENAFQDELQIFIRKQLTSSKQEECKKGIGAAVMLAKHAGMPENYSEYNTAQINSLLEIAMGSNANCQSRRGFFIDEFAAMVENSQLCDLFLETWTRRISTLATDHLFGKNIELQCEDFPMSLQYALEANGVQKMVFPAVDFVNKTAANKPLKVPVSVIPSILRLLWCLEGNSERMLFVFYSSVIMPDTTVHDDFNRLDVRQKRKVMDCLFLCGNYLIECVNALCAHGILENALLRVKQLISVRKHIAITVHLVPEYVPPLCQFYLPPQKPVAKKRNFQKQQKKGRKRKLEEVAEEISDTSCSEYHQVPGSSASCGEFKTSSDKSAEEADLNAYSGYFRELHHVTVKLLAVDSKSRITETDDDGADEDYLRSRTQGKPELQASVVLFLLQDIIYKFERIIKSEGTLTFRNEPVISPPHGTTPKSFITASIEILPHVITKIELFSGYCERLLKSNDWIYDCPGLFCQEARDVKLALAAGLKFLDVLITWRGFQNAENRALLNEILIIISKKGNTRKENAETRSFVKTAGEAASFVAGFSKTILILSGALNIIKVVQFCSSFTSSEEHPTLGKLCHEFLCRKWLAANGAPEKGPLFNQHVDFLLRTYFSVVDNKLEVVRSTAKIALGEIEGLTGKDSALKTFRAVNKGNFSLLYRSMCEALISGSASEFSGSDGDNQIFLNKWNLIVETLLVLVEIAKIHSSRAILSSLLKRSQSVIQLFLSKGMPVVETALRVKSVQVLTLLKSLQLVTRFLHSICCHSRITNDSVLAAHVPTIRSQCERLTLEVKGMMIVNEIPMECITIAILKNRDLKGNDIISQETFDGDSDDDDDDDDDDNDSELPPEDTPDDERELEPNGDVETEESNSEPY